jgi:hypothetical protein
MNQRGAAHRSAIIGVCICADIDALELGVESYDLVTFIASLHHMNNLADINAKKQLRPSRRLWAVEYIGPARFQFPDEDTALLSRGASQLEEILDARIAISVR